MKKIKKRRFTGIIICCMLLTGSLSPVMSALAVETEKQSSEITEEVQTEETAENSVPTETAETAKVLADDSKEDSVEVAEETTENSVPPEKAETPVEVFPDDSKEDDTESSEGTSESTDSEESAEAVPDKGDLTEQDRYDAVETFVDFMYNSILGRKSDESGLKGWTEKIFSGEVSLYDAVYSFYNSKEFRGKDLSDEDYVNNVFSVILRREPTSEELSDCCECLGAGIARNALLRKIMLSDELSSTVSEAGFENVGFSPVTELESQYPKQAQVARNYYESILGREPSDVELDSWINKFVYNHAQCADVLHSFYNSVEFTSRKLSDEDYVKNLFISILGRMPSQEEIDWKMQFLDMGVSRNYILRSVVMTEEFLSVCNSAEVGAGTFTLDDVRDENPYTTQFVAGLYRNFLGREFDENGLKNWVYDIRYLGWTASDVVSKFTDSKEFNSKIDDDNDYVATLYRGILGREPSDEEVSKWVGVIGDGYSRKYVLSCLIKFQEFADLCSKGNIRTGSIDTGMRDAYPAMSRFVISAYRPLGRVPGDTEIANRVQQLTGNYTGAQAVRSIFNSTEYADLGTSDETYVYDIFNAALGREPSQEEFDVFYNALENGRSRYDLLGDLMSIDEFANRCTNAGIRMVAYAYPLAANVLNQIGWNLSAAFSWSAGMAYYGGVPRDAYTGMEWYANYGFTYHQGNCYVMAATFCEMAKTLGYDAHQISGSVPLASGGYGPHSWVEINMNGGTYVFDPDFAHETGRNGYMIYYGQSGTWIYVKGSVMS